MRRRTALKAGRQRSADFRGYQFRVKLIRNDESVVVSDETDWMYVDSTAIERGFTNNKLHFGQNNTEVSLNGFEVGESLIETNNGHRGEVISNEQAILNNTVQEDMPMSLNVTSVDTFSFNISSFYRLSGKPCELGRQQLLPAVRAAPRWRTGSRTR
ncbi:hypothetical protein RB195_022721 [Necator americanus]|uniref:Uncharacterized protein n=1 Tax=Necator americanus TaxID=51031 RepID=A0ABR1EIJ5_NECAM